MDTNFATRIIGYGFGIFALVIFIYSFFYSGESALKEQAIFWFYSALIASLIPHIKHFKYKDLEVQFRENFQKLEKDVGEKIEKLEHSFVDKLENLKAYEMSLSPEEKARRQTVHTNYATRLGAMSEEEQLHDQEVRSRNAMNNKITLPEFKSLLKQAGYFYGEKDNTFTPALVQSIKEFQAKNSMTVDGIAGNLTIIKLGEVLADKGVK